jgi:RHS repeat-associated protein
VGTNTLTAVYYGPAFTNSLTVATNTSTVIMENPVFGYDAKGNLTNDAEFVYQYDTANRLTNAISKATASSVLSARYDGLGRRVEVTRNGATVERYVYFPGSFLVLAVLDGSNAIKEFYTHGPDLSGAVGGAGGICGILCSRVGLANMWLHADASGNIILATDYQGNEIGQNRYTPFGRLLNRTGVSVFRFGFSSKEQDEETGIIAIDYRCLHPVLGRFLQRDLIAESGGQNLYAFAGNAPPNSADYLGLIELEFNAFIPGSLGKTVSGALTIGGENISGTWLPEPDPTSTWWFGTDNRGFGGGGARVRSRSRDIRPTEIGKLESAGDLFITESDFSKRIRRSPLLGNIQEPVPLLEYQEIRAIPTQKVRVRDINPCKSQITVEAEGSYPFVKSAPKINYRVTWHLEVDRDTRKISAVTAKGSHNQFPAYEALVDGKSIYSFFPPGSGPTVWNLGFQIKRFEASK